MKFVVEFLLGKILEPLFYAYYHLIENFTAGKKLKKWQENLLKFFCAIVSYIAFLLVVIGAFFVNGIQPFKTYGIIFLIVGGAILLTHILIGKFAGAKRFEKEKRKEDCSDLENFKKNEPTPQIYYVNNDNEENDI